MCATLFRDLSLFWFCSFLWAGRRSRTAESLGSATPLHFLGEIFGGVGAIGGNGWVYDVRRSDEQNVHTRVGLEKLADLLLHTQPERSVVFIEPTCASWLPFVSKATSARTNASGNTYGKLVEMLECSFSHGFHGVGKQAGQEHLICLERPLLLFPLAQVNPLGDESREFVRTGNATARTLAEIIIPLCEWLFLPFGWRIRRLALQDMKMWCS